VLSFNSGTPFDVGTGKDIANTGNYNYGNGYGYERANVVGPLYPSDKTTAEWFNRASFTYPAQYTFGDLGRDTLRSDWYKNLDLSIFKELPITESKRFEFRAEMFNATNTPVWAVPNTSLDAPCVPIDPANPAKGCTPLFGRISSTANVARQIQFGLKFYF
jgi:hypothetical protein